MGRLIALRGYGLLYGGATVGAMGVVADVALGAGGEVVGVIPDVIREREIDHKGLTEQHVVGTMHERKACWLRGRMRLWRCRAAMGRSMSSSKL